MSTSGYILCIKCSTVLPDANTEVHPFSPARINQGKQGSSIHHQGHVYKRVTDLSVDDLIPAAG